MDQKSLQDALSLAQNALSDIYDDIEEEEEVEYSDIDDDVLDMMLEEESSNIGQRNKRKNVIQNNDSTNFVSPVDDKVDDKMNIEDNTEELIEEDKSEDIKDESEDNKQIKVPKKSVAIPEQSYQKSQPKKQSSIEERRNIKPTTKVKELEIEDFEEISSKRMKDPEEIRNEGFEVLEEILINQIENNKLMLKELINVDRNQAMNIKRAIQNYEQDLRIVKLTHATPNVPLPLYTIEEKNIRYEVANFDISEHELQVEIEKMMDVKPLMNSKDPYPSYYILCSFQHPESTQKFKTVPNNTYIYHYKHNFIIDRQKKLDKKKIVIEVYKPGQWFSESVLFGRCEIPLTDLFYSCTHYSVSSIIKDKKKVATLYLTLRIKYPLKERKYETKTIRQVIIKKHFGSKEEYLEYMKDKNIEQPKNIVEKQIKEEEQPKKIVEEQIKEEEQPKKIVEKQIKEEEQPKNIVEKQTKEEKQKSSTSVENAKQAEPPIKKTNDSIPKTQQKTVEASKKDNETKSSYYLVPLDHLFSIGVLEYEKSRTTQFLQDAKRKKNDDDIFELEQRLSEINTKIMILNYQAQSGQLTQEDYIEIVKKRIEEELLIAKKLKSTNKEAALEAMRRKKIMEKELAGG